MGAAASFPAATAVQVPLGLPSQIGTGLLLPVIPPSLAAPEERNQRAREAAKKEERKQKAREAALRQTARLQQAKKEKAKREKSDGFLAMLSSTNGGEPLDEAERCVLLKMLDNGQIQFGVPGFGDGGTEGLDNGFCFAILTRVNAPANAVSRRSHDDDSPFWMTSERKKSTLAAFRACSLAGILLILEGDSPRLSVMGTAARVAFFAAEGRGGIKMFGHVGRSAGYHRFELTYELVMEACDGRKAKKLLSRILPGGQTWAVDNLEGDDRVDEYTYNTVVAQEAQDLVQETSMGLVCYPKRGGSKAGSKAGSKTVLRENGSESFGGSPFSTFMMTEGCVTTTHLDQYEVNGEVVDVPAAATLWSVERNHPGPVKRAIVVCSNDRDVVIRVLGLKTSKNATCQYAGPIKRLEDLGAKLKEHKIRFVVVEFPPDCSYIIPPGCAHMFVTLGLVETSAWHPSL